ncbi:MAG TPA: hypothetical protein VGF58_00805 [Burkholderiales bacterium]
MDAIAPYLFMWNDWVVFPALLVVSAIALWKLRKPSLLVLTAGLALVVVAKILENAYPAPLHPAYVASIFVGIAGLVSAIAGSVWFFWKDYRVRKSAT